MPTTLDLQFNGANGSTTIPDGDSNHTTYAINGAHLSTAFAYSGASSLALLTDGDCVKIDTTHGDWGLGFDDFDIVLHWRPSSLPPDATGTWAEGWYYYTLFTIVQLLGSFDTLAIGVKLDAGGTQANFSFWFADEVPYESGAVSITLNAWNTVELVRVSGTTSLKINGTTRVSTTDTRWVENGLNGEIVVGNNFLFEDTQLQYALGHIDAVTMTSRNSYLVAGRGGQGANFGAATASFGDEHALTGASTTTTANALAGVGKAFPLTQASNSLTANPTLTTGTPIALTGVATTTAAHALTASNNTSYALTQAQRGTQPGVVSAALESNPLDLADRSMYGYAPVLVKERSLAHQTLGLLAHGFGGKSVSTLIPRQALNTLTPHAPALNRGVGVSGVTTAYIPGSVGPQRKLAVSAQRTLTQGVLSTGKVSPSFGALNILTPGAIGVDRQIGLAQAQSTFAAGTLLAGERVAPPDPIDDGVVWIAPAESGVVSRGEA